MSNRIDFYQSARADLSLPAATATVFVDGVLCPHLVPVEVVRSGWPEFGSARLVYNRAAYCGAAAKAAEEIERECGGGKSLCVRQIYNGTVAGMSGLSFPLFVGIIEMVETTIDAEGERVEITARDFGACLERVRVYGQRVDNGDGSSVFVTGAATVFDAQGIGNAGTGCVEHNGYSYAAFAAEPSQGRHWSLAEAIHYLLCEYLPAGRVQTPGVERLQSLAENQRVRGLDITGMNLADAIGRLCEQGGLQFKFVPRIAASGPEQAIVFYRCGAGRMVELNCQQRGERLNISKTNFLRLHGKKSLYPVTHKYIGQGDFKVYEATFELVKAWDPADQSTSYDKFSPLTNADFYKVKDVYRKWCLNEAGDYSGPPYSQAEAFDFLGIFDGAAFVRRRRRFWPALSADSQGRSLGYFLEVSWDGGEHWWQYLYAFNNLLDECGVWLSSDRLDVDTWIAALKGVLKFRITASVVSDERLSCIFADGPVSSTIPVVEHKLAVYSQFKYRKVSGRSIFAGVSGSGLGPANVADDSTQLHEFVRKKAQAASATFETVDVQTPSPGFDYQVGDRVTASAESRDVLGCRSDNRSILWIRRVQMDFQKQGTNLRIIRQKS